MLKQNERVCLAYAEIITCGNQSKLCSTYLVRLAKYCYISGQLVFVSNFRLL